MTLITKIPLNILTMRLGFLYVIIMSMGCWNTVKKTKLSPVINNDSLLLELNVSYGKGIFDPQGAFVLCFSNESKTNYTNCEIVINKEYRHSIKKLYASGKGVLETSDFNAGQQLELVFSHDVSNLLYFNIKEEKFKRAEIIEFNCDQGIIEWKW